MIRAIEGKESGVLKGAWSGALLFTLAGITLLAGCSGGDTANVQNPPPPGGSNLSIAFEPPPPPDVAINATAQLTAMVSEDSSDAGVDWSLACQSSGGCGTISPLHTDSGAAVTYTPPTSLSGNAQVVNITAFATADHTKNVLAPITVTAFGSVLKGTYVFQTSGIDITAFPYRMAGVVTLDGNGGITAGEQTYTNTSFSVSDPIIGGSYYVGADGRGTMILQTSNQSLGQEGVEFFSLVVLNTSQVLIAKLDDPGNPNVQGNQTAIGTLDLQTSTAAPSAGYAFVVSGTDVASFSPMAIGGILNIDSPNTITGAGSLADQDLAGSLFTGATLSGTVSPPDALGAVQISLSTDLTSTPIQFTGYIVDAIHIKLIETDNSNGTGFGATGGEAIGQGAATGTFTGLSAFSGDFVFGVFGQDLSGFPSSLSVAGVVTADGAGQLQNGFIDDLHVGLGIQINRNFTGTYTVDPAGTGRVDSLVKFRSNGDGPELIFYLTGNGNPPLVLDADSNFLGGLAVGGGIAYPATDPIALDGKYGLSLTQSSFGFQNDDTGQFTTDAISQTLSGVVDTNTFFTPVLDTPLTGNFTSTSVPRRFTGTLSNQLFLLPDSSVAYYVVDAGHGFLVETDPAGFGVLMFGYFAARTPVCASCP